MKNKKFWRWTNLAPETGQEGEAERVLELYGTIAEESWFDDDITPQMFREELFAGNGPVTICGGSTSWTAREGIWKRVSLCRHKDSDVHAEHACGTVICTQLRSI